MDETTIIGIDSAKHVFQLHGAAKDGQVTFRRKLSRSQLLPFLEKQCPCVVAMEACAPPITGDGKSPNSAMKSA